MVKNGQGAFLGIFMQTVFLTSRLKEMDFSILDNLAAYQQFLKD